MNDMSSVIVPKSTQLNADDLISGPRTITITKVAIRPGTEQPVDIHFDGDEGRPWKPCKSSCRVLVYAWGPDAKEYAGRSLTLYRDPKVKWAGLEVGGIRISHMSHIERDLVMALTESKQSRKPFIVKPLAKPSARAPEPPPPSARPHAPAEPDPEATTPAGDFTSDVASAAAKEWTRETAKARGDEIAKALRDHGGNARTLDQTWSFYSDEIATMPGAHQRGLRTLYETERKTLPDPELEPPEWRDRTGRGEDDRQQELV